MEEEKTIFDEVVLDTYDATDRPFDFVEEGVGTALICESDEGIREQIGSALKAANYVVTEPSTAKEAVKNMRFHVYDVVVVNDRFDESGTEANAVLDYLENLPMSTRRQIFVALVTDKHRTLDNMAAFNMSVNVTINVKNLDDVDKIIAQSRADNSAFYHIFNETLKKTGRI